MTAKQRAVRRRRIANVAYRIEAARELEAEARDELVGHKRRIAATIGGMWVARQRGLVGRGRNG